MFGYSCENSEYWLARDSTGDIYLYTRKPSRGDGLWIPDIISGTCPMIKLPGYVSQGLGDIQWTDPCPTRIMLRDIWWVMKEK